MKPYERHEERDRMVERQIARRGISDERVLAAMRAVPREDFVGEELSLEAYEDSPLPISMGQTISQPFIVARMCAALELKGDERVLEVGTGSGYAAAVLGELAREVWTIERHASLADEARRRLAAQGRDNVHVMQGDGSRGLSEHAPFDAIVVAAGGPSVPEALTKQLTDGGTLVIPIGTRPNDQHLVRVRRHGEQLEAERLEAVRFVPLVGEGGWSETEEPA